MPFSTLRLPPAAALFAILACLPFFGQGQAHAYPSAPLPAFVKPLPVPLEALPPSDQAGAGSYLLLIDEQEDLGSHAGYRHYATRILTEAGLQDASQIAIDRDPEHQTLLLHRITLWRNGLAVELLPRLKPTDMRREEEWEWGILDGRTTQLFQLEDVRVGDVIEHAYTLRGGNPVFGGAIADDRYLRFEVPVERIGLRLLHPASHPVSLACQGGAPEPKRSVAGGLEEWVWDLARVPSLADEAEAPSWYDPYPRVQWSAFGSWAEVAAWALPLYPVDAPLPPELERVAERLRGLPTPGRIRAALRLVQDDIRYLGLEMGASSHKPALPATVYARRFGDCKDKSLLFCALMRRLGVPAVPVLVNSRDRRQVEGLLPSPLSFDHVIARVELDGKRFYLDPTRTRQRGDPLESQDLEYGRGLAVAPGAAGLDTLEAGPESGGKVSIHQAFTVADFDSAATLAIRHEYTGGEADAMRARVAGDSREELGRAYLNYYAKNYPRIAAVGTPEVVEDTAANRLVLRLSYRVEGLCPRGGDGKRACKVYPSDIAYWIAEPDRRYRITPFALDYPKSVEQVITVALPVAAGIDTGGRQVETPDFRFAWSKSPSGKVATLTFAYQAKSDYVPLDRFAGYLDAIDDIEDHLETRIEPGDAAGPFTPVPSLVVAALLGLLPGLRYARHLRRLHADEPALPGGPPPPFKGWLFLLGFLVLMSPMGWAWYLSGWGYLFDAERWARLTTPGGADYSVLWAPFLMTAHAAAAALACCWGAVCGAFVRKQRIFVDAFVAMTLADLCYSTFEYVGLGLLPDASRSADWKGAEALGLVLSALFSLALIRIVTRSRLVAETFVAPRPADVAAPAMREKPAKSAESAR